MDWWTAWIRTAAHRAHVWPILCAVDHVTRFRSFNRANQRSRKCRRSMTELRCSWVKTALTSFQESTLSMPGITFIHFDKLFFIVFNTCEVLCSLCVCKAWHRWFEVRFWRQTGLLWWASTLPLWSILTMVTPWPDKTARRCQLLIIPTSIHVTRAAPPYKGTKQLLRARHH